MSKHIIDIREKILHKVTGSIVVAIVFIFCGICQVQAEEYRVGPGDVINITVYGHNDLTTRVMVNSNGKIAMPLIGQVKVSNLSIPGITKRISDMLADGYIVNPQVNVFIEEFRSKKVVVLGRVRQPGLMELSGAITFLELISKAGGLTEDAGDTATIKRRSEKGTKVLIIDMVSLIEKGDLSQNVQIMDGDTINISKAGMCFVTGEVKNPGTYPCGSDTTILKIVALSGGFTGKASESSVRIVRVIDNKKKVFKNVALDTKLQQDDVVVVPESFF